MKIDLQFPYTQDWKNGYIVTNPEGRKTVILYNTQIDRSSTQYARYLLSVSLKRYLTEDETVDHIDNNKSNDDPSNLQILTRTENIKKSAKGITITEHGTLSMYRYCKCDLCKLAKKNYMVNYSSS